MADEEGSVTGSIDEEAGEDEAEGGEDATIEGAGGEEDDADSSDDEDKPPPKETLFQKIKSYLKGTATPAQTYGPPYLEGEPKINQTLIDECDMAEPSVKEVHAVLNEGVHPDSVDPNCYNDTAMIKMGRHCYTKDSVKIMDRLKEAGAHLNKCNMLGVTPMGRACMARPPKGPPAEQRLLFIRWLLENGAEHSPIDKGGFTPMYHAAANRDIKAVRLLLEFGAKVRPNLTCKNPIEVATENNHKKLIVLLVKRAEEEEIERKRAEHARAEAQKRAAEHRRKIALMMEENASLSGSLTGPKYKLEKLSAEEMQSQARAAYEKAASDAAEASRRKDDQREAAKARLLEQQARYGTWKRVGKQRYRFMASMDKDAEEESRTMSLATSLYDDITLGPRERALRLRWQETTGITKRAPLPALPAIPDIPKKSQGAAEAPPPGQPMPSRSQWLTFPGALN